MTATGRQVIASAAANAVQEYMAGQNGTNVAPPYSPVLPTNADGSPVVMHSGVYELMDLMVKLRETATVQIQ